MSSLKRFAKDENAQAVTLDYILILSLTAIFLGGLLLSFGMVKDVVSAQAMMMQYRDVGNDIAGTIADVYMTGLHNGTATKTIQIPLQVAGQSYIIETDDGTLYPGSALQALKISAGRTDVEVYILLNNIDKSVNVSGVVTSSAGRIVVRYDGTNINLRSAD
ncbi:MAG: hypothetical protein QMC78_04615 [Methanocellales archaeon]|nr:hypothetical protein [Methanocellales archaeon]